MKLNSENERALCLYADLATTLGLSDSTATPQERFDALVRAIESLRSELSLPSTISNAGVSKEELESHLLEIVQSSIKIIEVARYTFSAYCLHELIHHRWNCNMFYRRI